MDIGFLLGAAAGKASPPPPLPSFPPPMSLSPEPPSEPGGSHSPVGVMGYNADDALQRQILAATKPSTAQPPPITSTSPPPQPLPPSSAATTITTQSTISTTPPLRLAAPPLQLAPTPQPTPLTPTASNTNVKKYVCLEPGCGSEFGQKGSLTRHQKSRHEGRRPHACSQCSKRFSEKWTLNVHERNVHQKRKPHACPQCSKRFGERWNLRKHVNVVHRNIKPYACPQCGRAFGYKGDMRKHVMELHVQDGRPFQCPVPSCGVKFARLRYLRRHQNLSHRTPPTCTSPTAVDHAWNNPAGRVVGDLHVDGAALPADSTNNAVVTRTQQQEGHRQGEQQLQQQMSHGNDRSYSALETLSLFAVAAARKKDLVGDAPE